MNWIQDKETFTWQVEGTSFGVEKIDDRLYTPFRLWGRNRVYVGTYDEQGRRKDLFFRSRKDAMTYVEEQVEKYLANVITAV